MFPQRPERIKSWLDCEIILYGANYNIRISTMNNDDCNITISYAANNKYEYEKTKKLLRGIKEVI